MLFADESISRIAIKRDCIRLKFGRAQNHEQTFVPAGSVFSEGEHMSTDSAASRARIDIHPPELGRRGIRPFETEHADDLRFFGRNPERSPALAIIGRNPFDLLGERSPNIAFESIPQM